MSLWTRFINLFRTGSLERELDDELRFHIESRIARNIQEGMTPEGAEEQARRQFGNRSRITREMQEVRVMKTSIAVAVPGRPVPLSRRSRVCVAARRRAIGAVLLQGQ
jgi:hypothetical protein